MVNKPRTTFDISREDMASLRELAAALGLFTSRGPMAGQIGNITALLTRLARAQRRDPQRAVATLADLLREPEPTP
ncbi:MAG TPA: hypothetical protein VFL91_22085 [Thermomicrobiales bacterium]|nr:hypothetical protein [Thermomicrobiales bacterium]